MQTIEIKTTQNVTIEYKLANLQLRIFATIIDLFVIGLSILLSYLIQISSLYLVLKYPILICFGIFALCYTLFFENILEGTTPGKRLIGIKVMKLDGSSCTFQDYFTRWAFRLLEIWFCFGILAIIIIRTSKNGQRIGDIISNTVLIQYKNLDNMYLKDIEVIDNLDTYTPKYQNIINFSEKEMLTIKELIIRYQKNNKGYEALLNQSANKIAQRLGLNIVPYPADDFLKCLIKDYVILTR